MSDFPSTPADTPSKKKVFSSNAWENATTAIKRPKMDLAKALGIMGFSSSRTLVPGEGHEPKNELNSALCKKMAELEKKKKGYMGRPPPSEEKQRNDVRILHEAYQFLSRRYLGSGRSADEEDVGISAMSCMLGGTGDDDIFSAHRRSNRKKEEKEEEEEEGVDEEGEKENKKGEEQNGAQVEEEEEEEEVKKEDNTPSNASNEKSGNDDVEEEEEEEKDEERQENNEDQEECATAAAGEKEDEGGNNISKEQGEEEEEEEEEQGELAEKSQN